MQNTKLMDSVEAVLDPLIDQDCAKTVMSSTENRANGGGEKIEYEYEFSSIYEGRKYFVGLWDTNDRSACERIVHRPIKSEDITYSDTGNGFITDEKYGLQYTFKKEPYKPSFELPEIGIGTADEVSVDEKRKPHKRTRTVSTEDALALLLQKVEPSKTINLGGLDLNQK